ncbi:MAG: hypothetical protein U0573_07000 [Phycisphaerales bacterium]
MALATSAFAAPARFDLTGEIPVSSSANRAYINLRGWVATMTPGGPVIWKNGSLQTIPTKQGRTWSGISGLNDLGDVSGTYQETGQTISRGWTWTANQLLDGPTGPSWMANSTTGINNRRDAGFFFVPFSVTDCANGSTQWYGKAGIGKPGSWKSAGAWSSQCTMSCTILSSVEYAINNGGDILANGYGTQTKTGGGCSLQSSYYVYWSNGTASTIPDVFYSSPPTMNDLGQVLSHAVWNDAGGAKAGIQFWSGGVATRLYTFGNYIPGMALPSTPLRMNSFGQIIASGVGYQLGFYQDGKWYDLRSLISLPSDVTLTLLLDINDLGQIVAAGKRGNTSRLFVLSQREACPADLNGDSLVDDQDYVIFVQAYNNIICPPSPAECPGDLNLDGVVDDADFQLFLLSYNLTNCP